MYTVGVDVSGVIINDGVKGLWIYYYSYDMPYTYNLQLAFETTRDFVSVYDLFIVFNFNLPIQCVFLFHLFFLME